MSLRQFLKNCLERLGVSPVRLGELARSSKWHLTPVHYYHPVPDLRRLPESVWTARSEMPGVDWNTSGQLALLDELAESFGPEYAAWPTAPTSCPYEYYYDRGPFISIDAEVLYAMIRKFRPRRIIEIGSGTSTLVAATAVRKNQSEHGIDCRLTAIEPYPNEQLRQGFPGLGDLIVSPVEQVPLATFAELGQNDILFIDSTHIVKLGGDVLFEFLEVIPRLRPGVLVHVHDVFLPAHYPREWTAKHHWFWTEQYLLQAFLCFNRAFEVLWSSSYLHQQHADHLAKAFPNYRPGQSSPGSFWMRRLET